MFPMYGVIKCYTNAGNKGVVDHRFLAANTFPSSCAKVACENVEQPSIDPSQQLELIDAKHRIINMLSVSFSCILT